MDKNLIPAPQWMLPDEHEMRAIEAQNARLQDEYQIRNRYSSKDAALIIHYQTKEKLARINLQGLIDNDESKDKINLERRRLSEALLMLGKLDEAIEYADSSADIIKIHRFKYAISKDDKEVCDCPDSSIIIDNQQKPLSRHYIESRILHPEKNEFVTIVTCSRCLHANATDNRTEAFLTIQRAREAGKELTDTEVLRNQ